MEKVGTQYCIKDLVEITFSCRYVFYNRTSLIIFLTHLQSLLERKKITFTYDLDNNLVVLFLSIDDLAAEKEIIDNIELIDILYKQCNLR